jgi:hypothetical protein
MRSAVIALSLILAVSFPVFSAEGQDRPPLRDNESINAPLLAGFVGDEIRKNCADISARMVVVWQKLRALEREAVRQGYSEAEIRAYVQSREEKRRMEQRRDAYLKANGVRRGDPHSYCALGRREIAANSPIGELLRSR